MHKHAVGKPNNAARHSLHRLRHHEVAKSLTVQGSLSQKLKQSACLRNIARAVRIIHPGQHGKHNLLACADNPRFSPSHSEGAAAATDFVTLSLLLALRLRFPPLAIWRSMLGGQLNCGSYMGASGGSKQENFSSCGKEWEKNTSVFILKIIVIARLPTASAKT
jgi:hypothetical protein